MTSHNADRRLKRFPSSNKTCLHWENRGGLSPKILTTLMPEDTQIQVREPAAKARKISRANLDKAARELNMLTVSSKRLVSVATIGQFISELGLMRYGNGRLLGSAQLMAQGAESCAEMAAKDGLDEEVRRGYLDLQLRFLKALDDNVALQLELNKVAERKSADAAMPQGKSFLPGAQIAPIQVNVHANSATITESTKEAPCPSQS